MRLPLCLQLLEKLPAATKFVKNVSLVIRLPKLLQMVPLVQIFMYVFDRHQDGDQGSPNVSPPDIGLTLIPLPLFRQKCPPGNDAPKTALSEAPGADFWVGC